MVALGVLDAVVQQAGAHRRHVELQVGDGRGDAERMDDVRVARAAQLAVVRLGRELVRALDEGRDLRPGDTP